MDARAGERGQVALYAVLMFPVLMLVLAFVLAVASAESIRTRIAAQVDMAALTATQAIDVAALAKGEPPTLIAPAAAALAREYLARNLSATGQQLAELPSEVASHAEVTVTDSGVDPFTGIPVTAPTISIRVSVQARIPMLGVAGLGPIVTFTVTGSAAARS